MIITGEREQSRHKIGEWFVTFAIEDRRHFVISCILLDESVEGIFQAHMLNLTQQLSYLFNSTNHLYKYLSENPQSIHQITENSFNFTFAVNNITHLRCIPMIRPQLNQSQKIMMKKLIPIIIQQKELRQLQNKQNAKRQKQIKQLNCFKSQLEIQQQRKKSITLEENALKSEIERLRRENQQLRNTLHLKQIILKDIKESKGEYVELD